ncbi:MAG TPA: hypothetical protein P5571_15670 [Candidatus Krumholzibacteria bacterium]|nr:hypothetical protein [Candidatus Krumholzibacteria bacterium]
MTIRYLDPLERAWTRARDLLLRPFDLRLWLIIGFTAWLARLWDGSLSGGDGGLDLHLDGRDESHGLIRVAVDRLVDVIDNPLSVFVVVVMLLLYLVVGAAIAWLASRGSFLFLDNVAHRRGRVSEPWDRLGRLGDSLFAWRVATQLLILPVVLLMAAPLLALIASASQADGLFRGVGLALALPLGALGVVLGLAAAFVGFCTDQFVVPLMYRHDEGILPAWERFLPLLRRDLPSFLLVALFYLALTLVVAAVVAAAGALTCCALFLVLAIPYVGTVVLLPVYVTARAFGPEFLAQFGPEFETWPAADPAPDPEPLPEAPEDSDPPQD